MRASKLLPIALRSLRVNMLRSILTMLGIIIGVSAVIIMVAIGAGAQAKVDEQIEALGGNILTIFASFTRDAGVAGAAGTAAVLQDKHASLIEEIPGVLSAAPQISSNNVQIIYGNLNWQTRVEGIDNRYLDGANWQINEGREFTAQEIASGEKVAFIGETLRRELFGESDPIGETIRVKNFNVTIIATLKSKGLDTRGNDMDDTMMMPLRTVRTKLTGIQNSSNPNTVRQILVKVVDAESMPIIQQEVAELLRSAMNVQPDARDPFEIRDLAATMESRAETTRIFNQLLAAVASVSLLVGGIGIMNIMLVSVTERTREIGLRMAVGARPQDILNQFLVEAVVLCGLGGLVGIAVAYITVTVLEHLGTLTGVINPDVIILSMGFSAMIGVFFGYYPALKASRLQPIDALRFE